MLLLQTHGLLAQTDRNDRRSLFLLVKLIRQTTWQERRSGQKLPLVSL